MTYKMGIGTVVIGLWTLACAGPEVPAQAPPPSPTSSPEVAPVSASPPDAPAPAPAPSRKGGGGGSKNKIGAACDASRVWTACVGDTLAFCQAPSAGAAAVFTEGRRCGSYADEVSSCVETGHNGPGGAATADCACREGATSCGDGGFFSTCVNGRWETKFTCDRCSEFSPDTHSGEAKCLGKLSPIGGKTGTVFGG